MFQSVIITEKKDTFIYLFATNKYSITVHINYIQTSQLNIFDVWLIVCKRYQKRLKTKTTYLKILTLSHNFNNR